jgi:DNA processing protein
MDKPKILALELANPQYPELLKQIPNPPPVLYIRGKWPINQPCITVVGSRKPTSYGIECAKYFTTQLVQAGFCIVSGLAFGIDAIAHQTTIDCRGATIAVLGSGPDIITPMTHEHLGQLILASGGAIVSEFPIGMPAQKHHFPQRDRIMSGLSLGTIVIEAAERSGALITARTAAEQGREVFAVPGDIFSQTSKGANKLIQEGAKLITDIKDILEEFQAFQNQTNNPSQTNLFNLPEPEQKILDCLSSPKTIDQIVAQSNLSPETVRPLLTTLELKSMILRRTDGTYQRNKS